MWGVQKISILVRPSSKALKWSYNMKYLVSPSELQQVESYDPEERMQYFLSRTIEAEEIWGLSNASGWVIKDDGEQSILPIWPYQQMAASCAVNEWKNYNAGSVSLEHFVYKLLPIMKQQGIRVEILPTAGEAGKKVDSEKLASIFDNMMESGEYYMEG